MPALPKPTEMPDLPSQMSALGLSDGARRLVLPASYSKRKTASGFGASQVRPNLPSPWEIAIAAVILALLLVWIW
jgi:hypothetical protein